MIDDGRPPGARRVLDALRELGVDWIVGIPDNGSAALFREAERRADVSLLTATREGEAIAVACGLWMGGRTAVVVIQNTGLLESGDSLRGTAIRMGVPLLMLVGYRGRATLPQQAGRDGAGRPDPEMLVRPDVDSVAVLTEPTLRAWSVPYRVLDEDPGVPAIDEMWRHANRHARPTAVLLPGTLGASDPRGREG